MNNNDVLLNKSFLYISDTRLLTYKFDIHIKIEDTTIYSINNNDIINNINKIHTAASIRLLKVLNIKISQYYLTF